MSLPSHYETTGKDAFGYALDVARRTLYMAAQKLAWEVPTADPESQYLFIFNPHAWEITTEVRYQLLKWGPETRIRVEDERENSLPHQWTGRTVHTSPNIRTLVAQVTLPAFGYRQIRIREENNPVAQKSKVHALDNTLENERLRVTFGESGTIGILDKTTGRQVFEGGATGARPVILDDPHDSWANIRAFDRDIASFGKASVRVLDNGPLFSRLRVRSTYCDSTLIID